MKPDYKVILTSLTIFTFLFLAVYFCLVVLMPTARNCGLSKINVSLYESVV